LRNSNLAPAGKTGLIISALFDYSLTKYIYDQGWDEAFRATVTELMINTLDRSIYPGLAESVIDSFTATPITIQEMTGSTDGAITGWSFTNHPMPAENRLIKIANSVNTPLPDVYQAGQWTYSPSGLPVSLITGKLAADKIGKRLKK
jgi:phytoene dehydrogenase-like protein